MESNSEATYDDGTVRGLQLLPTRQSRHTLVPESVMLIDVGGNVIPYYILLQLHQCLLTIK